MEDIYYKALKYCIETGQASVSMIQRRFPIGYIKSCKIIDWMEKRGFISNGKNKCDRLILISQEEYDNLKNVEDTMHDSVYTLDAKMEVLSSQFKFPVEIDKGTGYQVDMDNEKYSAELKSILKSAERVAKEYGVSYIASEHLVYAILNNECSAGNIMLSCEISLMHYNKYFKRILDKDFKYKGYTPRAKYFVEMAETYANDIEVEGTLVRTEHLLLAILTSSECMPIRIFKAMGVDIQHLAKTLEQALNLN